jgi:hypothetical protein
MSEIAWCSLSTYLLRNGTPQKHCACKQFLPHSSLEQPDLSHPSLSRFFYFHHTFPSFPITKLHPHVGTNRAHVQAHVGSKHANVHTHVGTKHANVHTHVGTKHANAHVHSLQISCPHTCIIPFHVLMFGSSRLLQLHFLILGILDFMCPPPSLALPTFHLLPFSLAPSSSSHFPPSHAPHHSSFTRTRPTGGPQTGVLRYQVGDLAVRHGQLHLEVALLRGHVPLAVLLLLLHLQLLPSSYA